MKLIRNTHLFLQHLNGYCLYAHASDYDGILPGRLSAHEKSSVSFLI